MPRPTYLSVSLVCSLCLSGLISVRSQISSSARQPSNRTVPEWNTSARNGTNFSTSPVLHPPSSPLRPESGIVFDLQQSSTSERDAAPGGAIEASQPEAFGNCSETCFRTEQRKGVSCAFVTSAGSLLSTNLGKVIDGYDVVMRTFWAPIKGYESHVGSRTDVRPVWSDDLDRTSPATYGIDGSERALVFTRYSRVATVRKASVNEPNSNDQCAAILKAYRKKFSTRNALSSSCILGFMSTFFDVTPVEGKLNLYPEVHYTPTTGFSSVNFLANVCDTVTVVGSSLSDSLDKKAKDAGFLYHYYPNKDASTGVPDKMYHHNFTEERSFYLKRSTCACRDGYTGVIFLDASKLRPLPPSLEILKHDEASKSSSPGGAEAVKRLFQQFKNLT